jgi:hypothetical protein
MSRASVRVEDAVPDSLPNLWINSLSILVCHIPALSEAYICGASLAGILLVGIAALHEWGILSRD